MVTFLKFIRLNFIKNSKINYPAAILRAAAPSLIAGPDWAATFDILNPPWYPFLSAVYVVTTR